MYKILLIEDDKFLQKAIQDKFSIENFELLVAGDGKEGLAKALETHPDFILLDLVMPVMDGEETLIELKKNPETKAIPVSILTAVSRESSTYFNDNTLLDQVVGYWEKDQNGIEKIVGKVQNYLDKKLSQ